MSSLQTFGQTRYTFASLRELLAKATPLRSGDVLAGVAAASGEERVAAQYALADVPLMQFLNETVIPYEQDEVTRLIVDTHDTAVFAPVRSFTVGEFRDWLLSDEPRQNGWRPLAPGLTPEMAAAVSKLMRLQDLILVARKIRVVTQFRTTVGLPGRLSTRLQPNHPTDDAAGVAASILDGLMLGSGDAVIGINPAGENVATTAHFLRLIDACGYGFKFRCRAVFWPCDDADGRAGVGCSRGSDLSIHCRNRGRESQLRRKFGAARRSACSGKISAPRLFMRQWDCGRQHHVL